MNGRSWDIIGRRRFGYALSLLIILPGIIALIYNTAYGHGALNWGVDFTGGNFLQLRLAKDFTVGDVRAVVDRFTTGQSVIQKSGQEALIRTRPLEAGKAAALIRAMRDQFGTVTVLRQDAVGPKIGEELRNIAILAVIIGLALQIIYIAVRFKSIRFAIAADMSLLHDLLVVIGVFAILRLEVDSSFVAILLTVVGYSINDTVVLFDRVRENLAQRTREPFDRLVNRSILEALVRSLNTALTTILAIAAVYLFGGPTIHNFALGLMVGIFTGGYSSILIACPILVDWNFWSERLAGRVSTEPVRQPVVTADRAAPPDSGTPPVFSNPPRKRRRSRRR